MKVMLSFMSKGATTCLELSLFLNLCQFKKNYVTNFAQSQVWWIVNCDFNFIKCIFIQIFVQVDPHVDYTMHFCVVYTEIRSIFYCFGIGIQKNCFVLPFKVENKLYGAQ